MEDGLELIHIYRCAVNTESFIQFIDELVKINKGLKLALFMDRASYHLSKDTRAALTDLGVEQILNAGASPKYNPIEGCFSQVKAAYKKDKLDAIVNGKEIDEVKMIKKAFRSLKSETIKNYVCCSMKALKVSI